MSTKKELKYKYSVRSVDFFRLIRHWGHQSFRYLDRTERIARIIFELAPTLVTFIFSYFLFDVSITNFKIWIICLFLSHTINWVFNSNWRACLLFSIPWARNPGGKATLSYIQNLKERLESNKSISSALIYGSLARNEWNSRSDIDIRFVRTPGLLNSITSICLLVRERFIAVINKQPLDAYLVDGTSFINKLRKDEKPIIIIDRHGEIQKEYQPEKLTLLDHIKIDEGI